jgi:hypothetical protein
VRGEEGVSGGNDRWGWDATTESVELLWPTHSWKAIKKLTLLKCCYLLRSKRDTDAVGLGRLTLGEIFPLHYSCRQLQRLTNKRAVT